MEFHFSNLGIVKEVKINLNGITVITGLNDTGKSFISKGVYSIIKTLNEYEGSAITKKFSSINNLLNQININHRQLVPFNQERNTKFSTAPVQAKISEFLNFRKGTKEETLAVLTDFVDKTIADIKSIFPATNQQTVELRIKTISQLQNSIIQLFAEQSSGEKLEAYFNEEVIQKQFQGQINNLNDEKSPTNIKLFDGATLLLDFNIESNKTKFNSDYIALSPIFKDATIIESPIIANFERYITFTLAYTVQFPQQQGVQLPSHYIDLTRKINASISNTINPFQDILDKIKKIIGGQVTFKPEQGGIVFQKSNNQVIRINNMATGIKSFGLLQILLTSGIINTSSLLIIDEPEVHLHPQWEIEYAKILVLLCKAGVQILISSHSPYFIEAISKASKQYQTPAIFYYGKTDENDHSTTFENVTENITPILSALAKPFKEMYNIQ